MPFPAYRRYLLNLEEARTREPITVGSKYLEIAKVSDPIVIAIGNPNADSITIEKPRVFRFKKEVEEIFVTNTPANGTAEIIATDDFFSVIGVGESKAISNVAIPDGTKRERVGNFLYPRQAVGETVYLGAIGSISIVNLHNPTTNKLLEVRKLHVTCSPTQIIFVGVSSGAPAASVITETDIAWKDQRINDLVNPEGVMSRDNTHVGPFPFPAVPRIGSFGRGNEGSTPFVKFYGEVGDEFGWLLPPLHTFYIFSALQNNVMDATLHWTEHLLDI